MQHFMFLEVKTKVAILVQRSVKRIILYSASTALTAPKSKQKGCCSIHCSVVAAVPSVLRILGLRPGVSYVRVEMDLGD